MDVNLNRKKLSCFLVVMAVCCHLEIKRCHCEEHEQVGAVSDFKLEEFLPGTTLCFFRVNSVAKMLELATDSSLGIYVSQYYDAHFSEKLEAVHIKHGKSGSNQSHLQILLNAKPNSISGGMYFSGGEKRFIAEASPISKSEFDSFIQLTKGIFKPPSRRKEVKQVKPGKTASDNASLIRQLGGGLFAALKNNRMLICDSQIELKRLISFLDRPNKQNGALSNNRKFRSTRNSLNVTDKSIAFVYADPLSNFDRKQVRSDSKDELDGLTKSGVFGLLNVGAVLTVGEHDNLWKIQTLIRVAQPRKGLFATSPTGSANDYSYQIVPGDSDFIAHLRFDYGTVIPNSKMILDHLVGESSSRIFSSTYLGVNPFFETNAKYFSGDQVIFSMDTKPGWELSKTFVRAHLISDSESSAHQKLVKAFETDLPSDEFDSETRNGWKVWTDSAEEWQQRKGEYFALAAKHPHLPKNLIYPRSTFALNSDYFVRFTTWESLLSFIESQEKLDNIAKKDWYMKTRREIISQSKRGKPQIMLVSRNGFLLNYFVEMFDHQYLRRLRPTNPGAVRADAFTFMKDLPRVDDSRESQYPVFALAVWENPTGYFVLIQESK